MADVPRGTPAGDVLLAVVAALPDLGNALTMTADGDAVVRLQVPPQFASKVAQVVQQLRMRTFYLCIVAKPHAQKRAPESETDRPADVEDADTAAKKGRHARRRAASRK